MLTLYGSRSSGNCYKPRLLLAKLGRSFRHVDVDSVRGATRTPDFLARNPNGKVPLLEFEDGRMLAESNAMLLHLAEGARFLPKPGYDRSLVYQWLFFEQYSHEPAIAVRRSLVRYPERAAQATPERMAALLADGTRALEVMEGQLARTRFIAGEAFTVADIALFAYTHDATFAGYDLARLPQVRRWLDAVEADAGHVGIDWLPGEAAADA